MTLRAALLSLFLGLFALAGSTSAQDLNVGIVNIGAIFQQLPQREQISRQLQSEFSGQIEEMQTLEQELQQMQERLQRDESIMSNEERQRASLEFQQKMAEAQEKGEQLNQQMQRRQSQERDRLLNEMQDVIADIAEAEDLDVVLEAGGIAYVRDSLPDISQQVLERMAQN